MEEQRRPLGVEHRGGFGHHPQQQCVEVDLGGDVGHEIDELHLLGGLDAASLVALAARERQRGLRGHRFEQLEIVVIEVPSIRFRTCATPITSPRPVRIGAHTIWRVSYPVVSSTSGLKSGWA